MTKKKTIYFSDNLRKWHREIYECLVEKLEKHDYNVKTIKNTKDIWVRDFMPIVFDDKIVQYRYEPDYLKHENKYRTEPEKPIVELGLETIQIDLNMDGGNMVKHGDIAIMTDKIFEANSDLNDDYKEILQKFDGLLNKIVIIPWDKEEKYGHADGMVRFIDKNHVLVNSVYDKKFKDLLHTQLINAGLDITELKIKENTKNAWGYINFMHLDNLIIQPSIDKTNDGYVREQLEKIYNVDVEICPAKGLTRKDGVFNCVSWEL